MKTNLNYQSLHKRCRNAAVIGENEILWGCQRHEDFIMIHSGTGDGSGIVANGYKLIYGHDGFVLSELGHTIIIPDGRRAPWHPKHGSLESYASLWCSPYC